MHITPKFLKRKDSQPPQTNSYGRHHVSRLYSRKKVISPVSSEAAIRKEIQPGKSQAPTGPTKNQKKFLTVNRTESSGNDTLIALSSNLDETLVRRRKLFTFIAKVVLWGIIFYALVLSALPAVDMIVSRWQY
jgi:hypothetical protein